VPLEHPGTKVARSTPTAPLSAKRVTKALDPDRCSWSSLRSLCDDPLVLAVDHLMMGVSDFKKSEERWQAEQSLTSYEGSSFDDAPGWGNWGVPLGDIWIEMVGILDRDALKEDDRAQMFSSVVAGGDRLMGWALAPNDLDALAARMNLPVESQSATDKRTGQRRTWRQVGFLETRMEPYLPFFVGWDHPMHDEAHEMTKELGNPQVSAADVRMELSGDPKRLSEWLGDIEAPCSIVEGPPALTAHIVSSSGDFSVS
jgi:hypothetical protein